MMRTLITTLLTLGAFCALLAACAGTHAGAGTASITGTAAVAEPLALPPGAVFEATLEDISRADAPAEVLGRVRIEAPGPPPWRFEIAYDPARVRPGHRHAVRARVTVDGRLIFTTDTVHPVLGDDRATRVDVVMRRVGAAAPTTPAAATADTARRRLGEYSTLADAGLLVDCASGERLPVAPVGDNALLEAAYLRVRTQPGAPVLAVVDARTEVRASMQGPPRPMLVVDRFVDARAGGCDAASTAPLENTYWKLVRLHGAPVAVDERQREPHLVLQPGQRRVVGSGGCNRLLGGYALDGDRLAFADVAATKVACPQRMAQERALLDALAAVERWRIVGERLELFDGGRTPVAEFDSVYLR